MVGAHLRGRRRGRPRLPRIGRTAWIKGMSRVTSSRLPPVTADGMPWLPATAVP
ncbi:hypothetical protein [Streptomyces sp. LN704]|uniref:hypothetical protein n=1 Tax=unclassified Streptomyces TaxID=2593676 RepID=UPI0037104A25